MNKITLEVGINEEYTGIQDALDVLKGSRSADAVICLPDRDYCLREPVRIGAGFENISIKFLGTCPNGTNITGAYKIKPRWQAHDENILVAGIGAGRKFDALYAGGKRQILARYPNEQANQVLGGYSADAISQERVDRWSSPAGGYIRALHNHSWGGNSYIIDGKTESGELLYHWVGDNNRGSAMHNIKRMVENIFEELDSPGEWFYNKETGQLYYWPPEHINPDDADFEIVTTEEFFRLEGTGGAPVSGITFENINFMRTHRTMFTGEYERPLRGDWGMVRKGAIFMQNAEDIIIRNCQFNELGGNAVTVSGYNRGHRIENCDFTGIGATGVLVFGCMSAVRDPSTWDGDNHKTSISDFTPGAKSEDYPREIKIADNYFYDVGVWEKQGAAVCLSISQDIRVCRNTAHKCARAGINICDGTFGGHLIEANDLFDCVTETSDHGPINAWGRDRFWSLTQFDTMGKYGKDKRPFALLDAVKTTVIRKNRIYANYGFGIDLDDGASNYEVSYNLCIGVGIKLREGFDRRVYNNLLIGSAFDVHVSFSQNHDLVYTNIVCNRNICTIIGIDKDAATFFSNNLYWNMGGDIRGLPDGDYKSVTADPMFRDFTAGDYTLLPESPAIAQGFMPFTVDDAAFGRADKPSPPRFIYADMIESDQSTRYHDVLLINIYNDGIMSVSGLPDKQGVYIAERDVLGLFCGLGLPIGAGDVIRKIGGVIIGNTDDFIREFEQIPLHTPIEIEIYRSQKPMTITFVKEN